MEYIATFYTHSGALKFQRYMRQKGIEIELMPVPRRFSSNCGIGAKFKVEGDIRPFISEDIEKLYKITDTDEILVYKEGS